MHAVLTLKQWSEGAEPAPGDLLSWSNLILERSRQVNDVGSDKVSQYFLTRWLECPKDARSVAPIFERTFQRYDLSFNAQLLDRLVGEGVLQAVDLVDFTKSSGLLQRYLLELPQVWEGMNAVQRKDHFHYEFGRVVREARYKPHEVHPLWTVVSQLKNPKERWTFFQGIAFSLRQEFGFLNDDKARLSVQEFHDTIGRFATAWNVHPAQVMYALLRSVDSRARDYDRYEKYLEPYTNDIVELLQFRGDPADIRIRQHLPTSSKPATIDMVAAFAVAGDFYNILMDKHDTVCVEYDPGAEKALGSLFDTP